MKKVFSKERFIEDMGIESYKASIQPDGYSYVNHCDGLTKEQIEVLGYETDEKWMIEIEDDSKEKDNKASIDLKVNVDDEGLEDTVDMLREATDLLPNITIRNNEQVYVTINYFNTTAKEYYKEEL